MKRALLLCALFAACTRTPKPVTLPAPVFDAPVFASDGATAGASEPTIVADSAGNLVVAWCDWTPPRPQVRFALSSNGGASFSRSLPVSPGDDSHGDGQADVSLVRTNDGRVALSWLACRHDESAPTSSACDVYAHLSTDMGRHWGETLTIAAGGPAHRERDWLATDGREIFASWTENLPTGAEWHVAALENGRFEPRGMLPQRASLAPLATSKRGLDAYLLLRGPHDPTKVFGDRMRSVDGGRNWTSLGTFRFDRSSALLPYSMGILASNPEGDAWLAIPRGGGESNDFVLGHRPAEYEIFRTAPTLRAGENARVGMPWLEPLQNGTMLAAWIEEHADGWRVMVRILRDERSRSEAVDVGRAPFRFEEASLTQNIGDYLATASARNSLWISWSDTTDGRARIRVARGRLADPSPRL